MTKKYTVASSKIVCKIPGRPPGRDSPALNDNPVRKLTKTTTEKAMVSEHGVRVEREVWDDLGDDLPKNRDSVMYNISTGGDLVNTHS